MASNVSLVGVSKQYKQGRESVAVLSGFNLEIPEKDFVAIMGPSGSGKTTLLNLIGALDTPTSGSVTVAGERIDQLSRAALAHWRARHVGFVGQQQRVAIARALIADPTILVCDEPTGDLDRHSAEEILGLVQILSQYGKTVVMVTHDPKAASYASRQLHVDKGQLTDGEATTAA